MFNNACGIGLQKSFNTSSSSFGYLGLATLLTLSFPVYLPHVKKDGDKACQENQTVKTCFETECVVSELGPPSPHKDGTQQEGEARCVDQMCPAGKTRVVGQIPSFLCAVSRTGIGKPIRPVP